jgi:hypothetical protein
VDAGSTLSRLQITLDDLADAQPIVTTQEKLQ